MRATDVTGWAGIRCPKCNCPRTTVAYTRHRKGGTFRVLTCDLCLKRFTTMERIAGDQPAPADTPA